MPPSDRLAEAQRILNVCNACRYCQGYCAVFPAIERRAEFTAADVRYLANLCHNCAECYYACQYAPPHEFAVNIPRMLAEVRLDSYEQYAGRALAYTFRGNGLLVAGILVGAVILSVPAALALDGIDRLFAAPAAHFYAVVPHAVMAALFGAVFLLAVAAVGLGFARCWRESGEGFAALLNPFALAGAARNILTLRYLSSGGAGCTYPDEHHSQARRWFHHLTSYGFLLCFAATTVAAFDHYALGRLAPYPYLSAPVILGTLGGVGLIIGPVGLYALKLRRDRAIADATQDGMDTAFLTTLFFTSLTGLLLLGFRQTRSMGPLLIVHLATVLALFVTLPYGKFVHGIYRAAALLRYGLEQRRGEKAHRAGQG
ncbi:MAG TPA: tricarballylate utilization 4Fe-4S protein TcuB [Bryobacteraceae bacterium]|nr:tricarballylate utilization 4Fe-4S protein TcuB [Bryobacteraceae bacterium]